MSYSLGRGGKRVCENVERSSKPWQEHWTFIEQQYLTGIFLNELKDDVRVTPWFISLIDEFDATDWWKKKKFGGEGIHKEDLVEDPAIGFV